MQQDSNSAYGWVSIILHWSTAILIIALWFIGKSIAEAEGELVSQRRGLHISLAASAWLLVLLRIAWRIRQGHPHLRGQTIRIHTIAKWTHYASLVATAVMLVSGPLLVWSRGYPVSVFNLFAIPSPIDASESLEITLFSIHAFSATVLAVLVVIHIGGALKHLMFHNDDTIIRMIWPGRQQQSETQE